MAFEQLVENTQFGKESANDLITETLLITIAILLSVCPGPEALMFVFKIGLQQRRHWTHVLTKKLRF